MVLNPANWSGRQGGVDWSATVAVAAEALTVALINYGGLSSGPDVISYDASPPDVVSLLDGVPAGPFVDFPVA